MDNEKLLDTLKRQTKINKQIEKILKSLTLGGTNQDLDQLKDLISLNQSTVDEFEKSIKFSDE